MTPTQLSNETWLYDGSTWSLANPSVIPAARSHGVVFSTVGVHFKQSNALSQPVSDLEPWGKRMSGIGDAFGGIGREGGRVVSPVRIRRRVRPDLGHVAKGEKGSGLTQALLDPG